MQQAVEEIEQTNYDNVRRIAVFLHAQILLNTPVDEGTARANWFVRVNSPSNVVRPNPPYSVSETRRYQEQTMSGFSSHNINANTTSIHLTNNLPYIFRLDQNYSPQTRGRGIVMPALQRTTAYARTLR